MRKKAKQKKPKKLKIKTRKTGNKKSVLTAGNIFKALKSLLVVFIFVSAGFLLYLAEKYIHNSSPLTTGPVELMNVPEWVGDQLEQMIITEAGGIDLMLNEETAKKVVENLSSVAWLDNVRALTTDKSIQVYATFRKPVAVIQSGMSRFYVDSQMVVLDYVPMPHLLIVEIRGPSLVNDVPRYGQVWRRDDLEAAIELLERIYEMDKTDSPDRPLLREIASIDVTNYDGREDPRQPHILLYTHNNIEIIWGAEVGKWSQHLESTDEQKLAKLFGYYKQHGTLSTGIRFINLRDPRENIPLPIDKY